MDTLGEMQLMELKYLQLSGLLDEGKDRDWYTIFYSRLCSADLLVLGINPGGDPLKSKSIIRASTTYYENWEHEYVDSRYPIQAVMLPFLKNILSTNEEGVRRIPKSNLAFRRSPGENEFEGLHGMTLMKGMQEAQETIKEMLRLVAPKMVLLEGMKSDQFRQLYCKGTAKQIGKDIKAKRWGQDVRVFHADSMYVTCLEREIPIVAVGHPSHFGSNPVWGSLVPAVREVIENFEINAH